MQHLRAPALEVSFLQNGLSPQGSSLRSFCTCVEPLPCLHTQDLLPAIHTKDCYKQTTNFYISPPTQNKTCSSTVFNASPPKGTHPCQHFFPSGNFCLAFSYDTIYTYIIFSIDIVEEKALACSMVGISSVIPVTAAHLLHSLLQFHS